MTVGATMIKAASGGVLSLSDQSFSINGGPEVHFGGTGADRILFDFSSDLAMRSISINGSPYLERYALYITEDTYIYLHRFVGCDGDRYLHSHPWPTAHSTILSGGYDEIRWNPAAFAVQSFAYDAGESNIILGDDLHQITSVRPGTWTLFSHGPWEKNWGFVSEWNDAGPVLTMLENDGKNRGWWHVNHCGRNHPERVSFSP